MLKKLLAAACLVVGIQTANAYNGQKVNSNVQKVTVFLNSAQVTRTAMVNINAGTLTLIFDNISPDIDVQSIQVSAAGNFTILSVKHELDFLNQQTKAKNIGALQLLQKQLRNKLDMQNNLFAIYQEEYNMLLKNQTVTGDNSNLDIVKLKQALEFQTIRLTEVKRKQQAVTAQIEEINLDLQKYDRQIAEITRGNTKATSNVLVTISSKTGAQSAFTLNYVVKNAGWYPTYDIRAKNVNSPINIAYKANVSQQCGEDWKNVKLTLSTGNPTISGDKPELTPNYLNFGMFYAGQAANITRVTGRVFDKNDNTTIPGVTVKVKGTSIATVTDATGNYTIQVPAGSPVLTYGFVGYETQERPANAAVINVSLNPAANQLNEVVVVGYSSMDKAPLQQALAGKTGGVMIRGLATIPVEVKQTENQTNVEFNIANPYSVPSDGKQYLVEINSFDIDADYQYYVAPKVSTDVFLTASLTDWNKYNFLSGEANLFFEGTFIGKSLIDAASTSDTLNLSLGTDKSILVTRILQKDLTEKKNFGSTKKDTRDWLITVKNRKSQPVKLLIEDQLPVSQNSAIEVESQETSGAKLDPLTGRLSWSFMLTSQQDKKMQVKYQVKYPKNQSVIVQ